MKKETKILLVSMVSTWNQFHVSKRVDAEFEEDEFQKGHWSLEVRIRGVVNAEFVSFILPAIISNNCHWFLAECAGRVVFYIQ